MTLLIMYSPSIEILIKSFKKLPTVGQKTAERFVFYLLKSGKKEVAEITLSLKNLIDNVKSCQNCWNFTDINPCKTCSNPSRDKTIICIVSEPQDLTAIEQTSDYTGLYFLLRGVVNSDQDNLDKLKIKELVQKIKTDKLIKEIILAFNLNIEGETTMMYLEKLLKKINPQLKITRLARGLPMNSDLQYADEITLGEAIKNRT